MAPMPSCRLEGSRHPMTQRPGPRGQISSQNSTPGRTPWANCPSQCQPFQCPPPQPSPLSTFSVIPFFLLPLSPYPSLQLRDPLRFRSAEEFIPTISASKNELGDKKTMYSLGDRQNRRWLERKGRKLMQWQWQERTVTQIDSRQAQNKKRNKKCSEWEER